MWGSTHQECTQNLQHFGMLEHYDNRRVKATPFMQNYAEKTIEKETKEQFNLKIIEFYEEKVRRFYDTDYAERQQTLLE